MKQPIVVTILLLTSITAHAMMLEQFCSVPLKPNYENLDPITGAVFWESGIIKRWFTHLPFEQPERDSWLGDGDGPTRLLHALFTTILNQDDIDISDNPSYVARHLQPSTIGMIIAFLEMARTQNQPITALQLENSIANEQHFAQSVAKTAAEKKQLTGKLAPYQLNRFDTSRLCRDLQRSEKRHLLKAEQQQLSSLQGQAKQKAQKKLYALNLQLKQLRAAKTGGDYNRIREFSHALLDALKPSPHFFPNTAYGILMAFLYRKMKTENNLANYLQAAAEQSGEAILDDNPKPMNAIPQNNLNLMHFPDADCNLLITQLYKPVLYHKMLASYQGAFPKKAEYTGLYYKGFNFSDCTETLIRNLCNRAFYQKESGTFELTKFPTTVVDEQLVAFYRDPHNQLAISIEEPECYTNWLNVVENRPWIAYRRTLQLQDDGTYITIIAPQDSSGFIKGIPPALVACCERNGERIKLGSFWYILVDDLHSELYEMEPSIHNIIIMLDCLLNLQLFQEPLEKEFMRPDFVTHYLPRIGERLPFLSGKNLTASFLVSLDTTEYTNQMRELFFDGCTIFLARSDADIYIHASSSTHEDTAPQLVATWETLPAEDHCYQKLLNLLALFPPAPSMLARTPQLLFWTELGNPEIVIALFTHFFKKEVLQSIPQNQSDFIIKIAASLIKKLHRRFDWRYHTRIMAIMDHWLMEQPAIKQVFDELVALAQSRMHGSPAEQEELSHFFESLVLFPNYHEVIRQAVPWIIKHGSAHDQDVAQQIITALKQ